MSIDIIVNTCSNPYDPGAPYPSYLDEAYGRICGYDMPIKQEDWDLAVLHYPDVTPGSKEIEAKIDFFSTYSYLDNKTDTAFEALANIIHILPKLGMQLAYYEKTDGWSDYVHMLVICSRMLEYKKLTDYDKQVIMTMINDISTQLVTVKDTTRKDINYVDLDIDAISYAKGCDDISYINTYDMFTDFIPRVEYKLSDKQIDGLPYIDIDPESDIALSIEDLYDLYYDWEDNKQDYNCRYGAYRFCKY